MAMYSFLDALQEAPSDDTIGTVVETIRQDYAEDPDVAASLAKILAASGKKLSLSSNLVADIASTGGPSSLSTLITPLILRNAGAIVPKLGVQGRPAGGIDCLAQIPRYEVTLSTQRVADILSTGGYAHFLASGEFAPLDGRMFRIRQLMNAQAVPALVTASLLAKKIAVGVQYVGLDIRVAPHGNFGIDWESAARNARIFISAASRLGIKATPVLTNGLHPYQPYIGRKESLLAMHHIFEGNEPAWLAEHLEVCRTLALACIPETIRAKAALTNRIELRTHFYQNLLDQGADPKQFELISSATLAKHEIQLFAENSGFCSFPLLELRDTFTVVQKEQVSEGNPFPDPLGVIFLKRPGTWVERGTVLATARVDVRDYKRIVQKLWTLICRPLSKPVGPNLEGING